MLIPPRTTPPPDAAERRAAKPTVVYPVERLPPYDAAFYDKARVGMAKIGETIVPPREGRAFDVPAGYVFRIVSIEGPQVGDLNLWNAADLAERFFSGKTRALLATHLGAGDRLWSALPLAEADGDHHARHARLVQFRRRRGRRSRRHRHTLRSLHQPAPERRRLPPLLPLKPDARSPGGSNCRSNGPSRMCTTSS